MSTPAATPPPEHWPDQDVPWHYGDPLGEQRAAAEGRAAVDRSNLDVIRLTGPERLDWLNKIVTQKVDELPAASQTQALILDAHGKVEHHMRVFETGEDTTWLVTEPGKGAPLLDYLRKMVFWAKVVPEAAPDRKVIATFEQGKRFEAVHPSESFEEVWATLTSTRGFRPVGTWADEALRVAALEPRLGLDTDERTLPHEVGWVNPRGAELAEWKAVHLNKGCYRGQETVSKIANVGRPPRSLALLHFDGEDAQDLRPGESIADEQGSVVGRLGTAVTHYELGSVALALVKRGLNPDRPLLVAGRAAQLDPDSVLREEEHKPGRDAVAKWRLTSTAGQSSQ
ncbi:YgfZ/GcvT domain-containing protein [Segniliparus rugosus]|uniref:Folate-binding protein YgfZ n=1 Tax=Segniliparus rugosus (strain ATCC BAA-974 / DSM 45345 / CCUG 50838 / CIP 108380 / JCM 13579 / CDC 945) TaxID=679197 RepID=E5XV73_SEGRC|nr:folate-binding protein YgfZ [Segniliparus rugosus]EFV11778.2 folate-binding protein YgfZ [Segniliparus rugosus ATCC BAA-974]